MEIIESAASRYFKPYDINKLYNRKISSLSEDDCSEEVIENKEHLLTGKCVLRGIPFDLGVEENEENVLLIKNSETGLTFDSPLRDEYILFLHAADMENEELQEDGIQRPMMGTPRLGEEVAEYILNYADGKSEKIPIKRRFNINDFMIKWGENGLECVSHMKPESINTNTEDHKIRKMPSAPWGMSQTRVRASRQSGKLLHWIFAVKNPYPEEDLLSIKFVSGKGTVLLFGITGCSMDSNPLRWEERKKMKIRIPRGICADDFANSDFLKFDMGQIISVSPVLKYNNKIWEDEYNNKLPEISDNEVIVEYTAHPKACLYIDNDKSQPFPLEKIKKGGTVKEYEYIEVSEAKRKVTVKVLDKKTGKSIPVKIHIHGEHGEYLPPANRHRIPNRFWFEDYSVDYTYKKHHCTYIDGKAEYKLPLGEIFVEISKGFEIVPIHKTITVREDTNEIVFKIKKALNWREKGWVTADTHVHFLSPQTALLEGEAEGVNVINLLASQWGELFTNIGDFDGRTTVGSEENGGTGEYLVRVGTENRQHVLGHISLLGYEGDMILPLTTGGPDESALGDPVEILLGGWAEKCREQNGISILPHFPSPRTDSAAAIVLDLIDGVEMNSANNIFKGISPYSLSDWYRYLNCGYQVPAVGGTDKMSAETAVGTIRTYALIEEVDFTYKSWMDVIKKGTTFVSHGPLIEFYVNGINMGGKIDLPKGGGTLEMDWHISSVTIPVTKIELVVNGETKEVKTVDSEAGDYYGNFSFKAEGSCWAALRVRGYYPGKPEIITAHTSAVMVNVDGSPCFNAIDAMTILEQIEGATAYISSIGTKADDRTYKKMLEMLTSAGRKLHNKMHNNGIYHEHDVAHKHHDK